MMWPSPAQSHDPGFGAAAYMGMVGGKRDGAVTPTLGDPECLVLVEVG